MSTFPPTTTVFNDGYIAETYEAYRVIRRRWTSPGVQFFRTAEALAGITGGAGAAADPALLRKTAGAAALTDAIRHYGHLAVQLDRQAAWRGGAGQVSTASRSRSSPTYRRALGYQSGTAADVVSALRGVYCGKIGLEFAHLGNEEERLWFRRTMEEGALAQPLSADELHRAAPAHGGRWPGAVPSARLSRVQAVLDRGVGRAGPDDRRSDRAGSAGRRATGRDGHGAPRPSQRAHPCDGDELRRDVRRVRGAAGGDERRQQHGRREVPPRLRERAEGRRDDDQAGARAESQPSRARTR